MHAHKNNKVNLSVTGERCDKRALNVNVPWLIVLKRFFGRYIK